jgi:lipocalin
MNHLIVAAALVLVSGMATLGCAKDPGSTADLPSVANLDLKRWEGPWYELARIPVPIGRDWANTVETYTSKGDGSYSVVYEGSKGSPQGAHRSLRQRLRIPDPARPGEMQVSFLPLVWLDYRLIYMDADYRFMLVIGSTRNYLWLMGRDRKPSAEDYAKLLQKAAAMGFEVSRLERVPQD